MPKQFKLRLAGGMRAYITQHNENQYDLLVVNREGKETKTYTCLTENDMVEFLLIAKLPA